VIDSAIAAFRELVRECDSMAARLGNMHGRHIVCRKGCSDCCVNLNVFPVEFYSILDEVNRAGLSPVFDENAQCGFLDAQGGCVIYKHRPIICRTHGLAIVFHTEIDGEMRGNVSFCDFNFRGIEEDFVFDKCNTLNIDALNDKLFAVNLEFITNNPELRFDITDRIPLKRIIDLAN
jgi:uncharacterized protein